MKQKPQTYKGNERGNALFLILIAVALFAALSYAVTQSGRGSGGIERETSLINSAQLTQYPAAIRTAVTRMVLTGTAPNAVSFDTADTDDNAVFGSGGGVSAQTPPTTSVEDGGVDEDNAGPNWRFKAIPSNSDHGHFVSGIGSAAGREAFAFIGLNGASCNSINTGLGLGSTPEAEVAVFTTTASAEEDNPASESGTATSPEHAASTIGKGHDITLGAPQAFACISNHASNTTGPFIYYHALIEQ